MLKTDPAVFAVGNQYQIMAPVEKQCLFWVEVGTEKYFDSANGVLRSDCHFHRVELPMSVLDGAGKYTVCTRTVIDRKPYSPEIEDTVRRQYSFTPVKTDSPRVYCISDAHCQVEEPIRAARAFGKIDLLILDGDLPDCAYNVEFFEGIYRIAAEITHGGLPIVSARGNHDLRGYVAERYAECFPNQNGNTYYTFRLGSIWGVVLDCGEDKADDFPDYNGIICCHEFRRGQTAFLQKIIENAEKEYLAPGVKKRWVICHNPFVHCMSYPFDIETDIYGEWIGLLREMKPDYMICGHLHSEEVHTAEDGFSTNGALCPVLVGGIPGRDKPFWHGMGLEFSETGCHVAFTDQDGTVLGEYTL